jgi:hypothetical protein
MTQTAKISNKKRNAIIAGAICTVVVLSLVYGAISYQPNINMQNKDSYVPKLISSNINYFDNRSDITSPFLHVVGTVQNTGNATANNCRIRAYASQDGNVTAIDTSNIFNPISAGGEEQIEFIFPYNGSALVVYNTYFEWTT